MSDYLLQGDDEARRLMQQAAYLAPHTERALRAAGIGPGASVLDLGCGMGDVALLAAELVRASSRSSAIRSPPSGRSSGSPASRSRSSSATSRSSHSTSGSTRSAAA
jgi:SAM-dependent methyltransferase